MVFPAIPNFGDRGRGSGRLTTVCGTVLFRPGFAEWTDIPLSELGDTPLDDIGARFRAVADYASRHGYVGGLPNFFHAQTMIFDAEIGDIGDPGSRARGRPGIVCGTILLRGEAAEWRDVVTLFGPG
jgi:hypothetical protein